MREVSQDLIVALILYCLGGLVCFLAWNGWAWEFNLPQFSYWHWVATYAAVRFLIHGSHKGK